MDNTQVAWLMDVLGQIAWAKELKRKLASDIDALSFKFVAEEAERITHADMLRSIREHSKQYIDNHINGLESEFFKYVSKI